MNVMVPVVSLIINDMILIEKFLCSNYDGGSGL